MSCTVEPWMISIKSSGNSRSLVLDLMGGSIPYNRGVWLVIIMVKLLHRWIRKLRCLWSVPYSSKGEEPHNYSGNIANHSLKDHTKCNIIISAPTAHWEGEINPMAIPESLLFRPVLIACLVCTAFEIAFEPLISRDNISAYNRL